MAKRKPVELMRRLYGGCPGCHICAECCNFTVIHAGRKKLFKCKAYGVTCSSASDWAKRWEPCGLFGKPADRPMVTTGQKMAFAKAERPVESRPQIEGQIEMEAIAVEQQQTAP